MSTNMTLRNTDCIVRVFGRAGNIRVNNDAGGKKVRNISVAFSRAWKKQDSDVFDRRTQWVEFALWEQAADRASSIEKGDVVSCEFSLADLMGDPYEKDGKTVAAIKCVRGNVLLVAKHGDNGAQADVPAEADIPVEEAI